MQSSTAKTWRWGNWKLIMAHDVVLIFEIKPVYNRIPWPGALAVMNQYVLKALGNCTCINIPESPEGFCLRESAADWITIHILLWSLLSREYSFIVNKAVFSRHFCLQPKDWVSWYHLHIKKSRTSKDLDVKMPSATVWAAALYCPSDFYLL